MPSNAPLLGTLFVNAFRGTADCGWMTEARLQQFANEAIHGYFDYELWRREEAGDLSDAERARMEAQWEEWHRQLVTLERDRNLSAQSSIRSRLHRRPE